MADWPFLGVFQLCLARYVHAASRQELMCWHGCEYAVVLPKHVWSQGTFVCRCSGIGWACSALTLTRASLRTLLLVRISGMS